MFENFVKLYNLQPCLLTAQEIEYLEDLNLATTDEIFKKPYFLCDWNEFLKWYKSQPNFIEGMEPMFGIHDPQDDTILIDQRLNPFLPMVIHEFVELIGPPNRKERHELAEKHEVAFAIKCGCYTEYISQFREFGFAGNMKQQNLEAIKRPKIPPNN